MFTNGDRYGFAPDAVLAAVAVALYLRTVGFDFMLEWDDGEYVVNNAALRELGWSGIKELLTSTYSSLYAPVHMLSYLVDRALWGFDPAGYHSSNVLLHAINSVLVYRFAYRASAAAGAPFAGGAFFAALLFAVHPVNVENVAWVAERKTLLSTTFALAACLLWPRFRDTGRWRWHVAALACMTLAVFAKASVVGIALMLAIYDWMFAPERVRAAGLRRRVAYCWPALPLVAVAVFAVIVTSSRALASGRGAVDPALLEPAFLLGTVYPTMVVVAWEYLRLLLWPAGLNAYYDVILRSSFLDPTVLAGLIAAVVGIAALLWRGTAAVRFWTLWTLVTIAPHANIVPNATVFYADRYLYLPQIGVFMLLALAGVAIARRSRWPEARLRRAAVLATLLPALLLGVAAWQRSAVWRSELALWEDTAAKSPDLYKARLNLGVVYHKLGRLAEAEREYRAAYAIWRGPEVIANLRLLRSQRRTGDAVRR